jgi:hypothetical protein
VEHGEPVETVKELVARPVVVQRRPLRTAIKVVLVGVVVLLVLGALAHRLTGSSHGVPTGHVTVVVGSSQALVKWEMGGVKKVETYTASAQPGGEHCTVTTGKTSCVVGGLTNGRAYKFGVSVKYANGSQAYTSYGKLVRPHKMH